MESPDHQHDDVLDGLAGLGPPGRPATTADIAAAIDDDEAAVAQRLDALAEAGVVESMSVGGERVWWRPRDPEGTLAAEVDAFRVELDDTLRPLSDPSEIQRAAARLLGQRMDADRALYLEVFPDGETLQVRQGFHRDDFAAMETKHRFSDFGADIVATLRGGDPVVVDDVTELDDHSETGAYLDANIHAYLTVPLLKDDRLAGLFTLHQFEPREWDERAVRMTRETVERTWEAVERASAERELAETNAELERLNEATRELLTADEAALRERVADIARTVLDCAATTLWCYDADDGELRPVATAQAPDRVADTGAPSTDRAEAVWETFVDTELAVEDAIEPPAGVPDGPTVEPIRSRVLVPLGRHGVLEVRSTEPGRFDSGMLDLVETLGATVETAWNRAAGEAELQRRNRELTRLDELNTLIRHIGQAIVDADTVADIDETVCARLADSALYEFAWVGRYDADADTIEPRAWAGIDSGAVEGLAETAGYERLPSTAESPLLNAVRTGELQTVADIARDTRTVPWREVALERGARSCYCLPLGYEDSVYGLLVVYGGTPDHDQRDTDVLGELADIIAHAIHSTEVAATQRANTVVELTLRTDGATTPLVRLARELDAAFTGDGRVLGDPDRPVVVFTATGTDAETLEAAAASSFGVETFTVLSETDDGLLCKAQLTDTPLAAHFRRPAATVRSLTVDAGVATTVVTLPETAMVREYVDAVREAVPGLELVARHTRERTPATRDALRTEFDERLTPRQQEVLAMAYRCGFFETPRVQTGAELADAVGIAQSTFNYHLRGAQRKLLDEVFGYE